MTQQLTAVIYADVLEGDVPGYVARCPELGITSQGDTVEHARAMLQEAVEGILEVSTPEEIEDRLSTGGRIIALMPLGVELPQIGAGEPEELKVAA